MSNQPETNETPATGYTPAPRKVGLPRFFELLGRDFWPLYKSSILCPRRPEGQVCRAAR